MDPEEARSADPDPLGFSELADGSGQGCCGEGAHGSEGLFARLGEDGNLGWPVSSLGSNPFERAKVHGSPAYLHQRPRQFVTVDLTDPYFA